MDRMDFISPCSVYQPLRVLHNTSDVHPNISARSPARLVKYDDLVCGLKPKKTNLIYLKCSGVKLAIIHATCNVHLDLNIKLADIQFIYLCHNYK